MIDKEKSLAYSFPELAKEWHSSKNGDLTPFDVTSGSKKKVWWICERGHLWDAQIYNRTAKKTGCPYCSGRQPIVGETDLASRFPELVKEWDFEKNSNLSPSEVTGTSSKKVWWKGKCGHSWSAQISNRTSQKSGCPICSNQMVLEGYNDLMSQKPEVIHEWDFDKNDALGIKPNEVFVNTGKAAWWICNECGHNWQAPIKIRVAGSSCPECAKKTRIKSQREQLKKSKVSFAVTNSLLLEEWDCEKNNKLNPEDYSAGSAKKVWWVCQKGHSWEAAIKTRCAGIGCPECAQEKHISFPEKAIAYYLKVAGIEINENYRPDFLNGLELDIYIPSMRCAIEYDGQRWHKNIEKDIRKDLLCKEHEIRLIRLREPKCPKIESESIVLDSLTYKSLTTAIQTLFELLNLKSDIDVVRDEVQIHELILYLEREHSFAVQFPKIAEEWHPIKNGKLKPNNVTPFSGKMVWWKGFCGHEWKMKVANRSLGQKCPICQNKRVVIGMNDLATSNPEIIEEWDCEKNKSLSPRRFLRGATISYGGNAKNAEMNGRLK